MSVHTATLTDRRWAIRIAPYMAARGVAAVGLGPILAIYAWLGSERSFGPALAVALSSGTVPMLRTLLGGVTREQSRLVIRNPFRTIRVAIDQVEEVLAAPLWQNFYVVAAIRVRTKRGEARLIKIPPLGEVDVPRLRGFLTGSTS